MDGQTTQKLNASSQQGGTEPMQLSAEGFVQHSHVVCTALSVQLCAEFKNLSRVTVHFLLCNLLAFSELLVFCKQLLIFIIFIQLIGF